MGWEERGGSVSLNDFLSLDDCKFRPFDRWKKNHICVLGREKVKQWIDCPIGILWRSPGLGAVLSWLLWWRYRISMENKNRADIGSKSRIACDNTY